jgi:hypothetical protein
VNASPWDTLLYEGKVGLPPADIGLSDTSSIAHSRTDFEAEIMV